MYRCNFAIFAAKRNLPSGKRSLQFNRHTSSTQAFIIRIFNCLFCEPLLSSDVCYTSQQNSSTHLTQIYNLNTKWTHGEVAGRWAEKDTWADIYVCAGLFFPYHLQVKEQIVSPLPLNDSEASVSGY